MGFKLTHLQGFILFLVVYTLDIGTTAVFAAVNLNVTIDYQDSSITYSPPGAWSQSMPSKLDLGGAHMLTQNPNATASFNFTGKFFFQFNFFFSFSFFFPFHFILLSLFNQVDFCFFILYYTICFIYPGTAIYFVAPLWPYLVNTAVSLDSGPITIIDLMDHSSPNTGQGPETIPSQVVWQATGLANTQHNLLISVGPGQPYAIVDGLMYVSLPSLSLLKLGQLIIVFYFYFGSYTTVSNISSSTSSSHLPTSTSSLPVPVVASSTASATSSPLSSSKSVVAIALGSVFGVLGLLIILIGGWYLFRRRKRPNSEAWTIGGASNTTSSMSRNPSVSAVGPNVSDKSGNWTAEQLYYNGYHMNQSDDGKSWHNPRYEYVGMPAPPIPSYHRGGYQNDISLRTPMHQHQMTGRTSNRYEPGCALSTITERSTPQMGEGRTPLGNSPASYQSDLEYYTAQGSEASYSVSRTPQEQQPSSNIQRYPSQRRKPVEYN